MRKRMVALTLVLVGISWGPAGTIAEAQRGGGEAPAA